MTWCGLVWDIVHPGIDDQPDVAAAPGLRAAEEYEEDDDDDEEDDDDDGEYYDDEEYEDDAEEEEFNLNDYDAGIHGWWTCAICGFDVNDHNTCMGCGHPLTPDTFSLG